MPIKPIASLLDPSSTWPTLDDAPHVLVIGAGVAGLSAARRLRVHGVNVTVFEARDRLGGRACTDDSLGHPLSLGAAWIHGIKRNPLNKLVKRLELDTIKTDYDEILLFDRGGPLDEETTKPILDLCWWFYDWIEELHGQLDDEDDDISVATAMARELTRQGGPDLDMMAFDYGLHFLQLDEGMELGKIGLRGFEDDDCYEGPDKFMVNGYQGVVEHLAEGLDIKRSTPISKVEYTEEQGASVMTASGEVFTGTAVLVTVPLGVLKSGMIDFEPALPDWKQEAIEQIGFGCYNKVVLKFDEVFWPEDPYFIGKFNEPHNWAAFMLNYHALCDQPILGGVLGGIQAKKLEDKTDEQLIEMMMRDLRQMFGPDIPQPIDSVITRWGKDPYALGAYAHCPVGVRGEAFETLGEPVGECLFFAGSATDEDNYSTVSGALDSGLREANRIVRYWVDDDDSEEDDED